MENIVTQLVKIGNSVEIVNEDLKVLEATEIASKGNWIDCLNNSSKGGAHLIEELQLELCHKHLGASVK